MLLRQLKQCMLCQKPVLVPSLSDCWVSSALFHGSCRCPCVRTFCCCHCRASRCTPLLILSRSELTTQLSLHRPRHRMQLASCTLAEPQVLSSTPALLSLPLQLCAFLTQSNSWSKALWQHSVLPSQDHLLPCSFAHLLLSSPDHLLPSFLGLSSFSMVIKTQIRISQPCMVPFSQTALPFLCANPVLASTAC